MKIKSIFLITGISVAIFSCKKEDPKPDNQLPALVIPANYDSANYTANILTEVAIKDQMKALDNEFIKGRDSLNTLSYSTLTGLFHAGTPSFFDISTSYITGKIDGINGWLDESAKASGKSYVPGATGTGGVYVNKLFDEHGLEYEELVEKAAFSASLYNRVCTLLDQPLTLSTSDQIISLYGASPSFVNSNTAALHGNAADTYLAGYTARRDKNDGNGLYTKMKKNIITLQTAVKAGPLYQADQKSAAKAIKTTWEKACAATCINYLHSVTSTLSGTSLTDAQKSGALHSLSEAIGFIYGWENMSQSARIMTDAQVNELLALLNCPHGNEQAYLFITDTFNQLPKLTQVIDELQSIYGFSEQDIEDFKNNWVSIQGR